MKKLFCLLFITIMMSGCATGYHKRGLAGGYTDSKLQDNIFKVRFNGNGYCGSDRAEDFTLLRCAEVARENGYKYFVIIAEKSGTQVSAYTTPTTANTYGSVNTFGNTGNYYGTTTVSGGQTYMFQKPSTSNTIMCFAEKPENIPTIVYDADQITTNIRQQYGLK